MCGIAVIASRDGSIPDIDVLESMTAALAHRGPDDSGFHRSGWVGIGFRRLSILDLTSSGHQPMTSRDGRITLAFNGEIYNYVELREELRALGYEFRSTGDAEVLLAAYQKWGRGCLERLNGMWAFVIHDQDRDIIFGSRDRFGEKPLYWFRGSGAYYFASEIKSIRASGRYQTSVNWDSAARYLINGQLDDRPATFFDAIEQVPAGSYFELDRRGVMQVGRYWKLEHEETDTDGGWEEFADLFERSVRIRLRSDVPVGVCLSGGLDSTSIICAMARERSALANESPPMLAFSYNPPEFDESPFLQATIRQTQADLVPLHLTGADVWSMLQGVLEAQDEPVHSVTAVVGYGLMRLARENGVPVVLNGQGADEVLAGYPSYFRGYWYTLLRRGFAGRTWDEIGRYAGAHGERRMALAASLFRHALLHRLSAVAGYQRVARAHRRYRLGRSSVFTPDLVRRVADTEPARPGSLNEELAFSVESSPLPLYLRVEDRNAMAHGVEARLPFLDHRLVSFVFSRGAGAKMSGPWNKHMLRMGMKGRIPEVVRTRVEKFGFPTPIAEWVARSLREPIRAALAGPEMNGLGIYDRSRLSALHEAAENGDGAAVTVLMRIVQFHIWMQGLGGPGQR